MEELIQKIDELIITINNNSLPLWLSIVGILVPIFISIIVAIQAYIQHNSNKQLQIYISEKESRIQMHSDFLAIYDSFCVAQNCIGAARNQVDEIFAIPNLTFQWHNDMRQALSGLCQATNRARLLLPTNDVELRDVLQTVFIQYRELVAQIDEYISTGTAENVRVETWGKLNSQYGVFIGNYAMLSNNISAYSDFVKLCSNDTTKSIKQKIEALLPLFEYEKFDKFFEPYLRINSDIKENKK